jgi:hypothetical protein
MKSIANTDHVRPGISSPHPIKIISDDAGKSIYSEDIFLETGSSLIKVLICKLRSKMLGFLVLFLKCRPDHRCR